MEGVGITDTGVWPDAEEIGTTIPTGVTRIGETIAGLIGLPGVVVEEVEAVAKRRAVASFAGLFVQFQLISQKI